MWSRHHLAVAGSRRDAYSVEGLPDAPDYSACIWAGRRATGLMMTPASSTATYRRSRPRPYRGRPVEESHRNGRTAPPIQPDGDRRTAFRQPVPFHPQRLPKYDLRAATWRSAQRRDLLPGTLNGRPRKRVLCSDLHIYVPRQDLLRFSGDPKVAVTELNNASADRHRSWVEMSRAPPGPTRRFAHVDVFRRPLQSVGGNLLQRAAWP